MSATTAQEVYESVRSLSLVERLRLAALILQDVTRPGVPLLDLSDAWSEQDERDVTTFSLRYASELYPEEEENE